MDYTDKSTFETEKSMLTSRFLKIVCFGAKSFSLCKSIREKRCIFIPINRNFADSAMTKFILNRPDDYLSLSKKRIIGTTLKWFVILMVGAIMLRIACVAIYMSMGVNPMDLTKFGGDPTNYVGHTT